MAKTKKTTKKAGGSKASSKKDIKKTLMDTGKKTLLIVGAIVGGKLLSSQANKILKKSGASTKINGFAGFEASGLITPIVLMGVGVAGNYFLKNEDLKLVSTGVAAAGAIDTVSVLIKKDVLNAFGNVDGALTIEPYKPDLPEIENRNINMLQVERGNASDYTDYEEIGQIL